MKLSTTVLRISVYLWFFCVYIYIYIGAVECVSLFSAWDYLFLCVHNSRLDTFSISILKSKYFMAFCSSGFAGLPWIRYVRSFSKWMWVYSFVYYVKDHACQVWWFNVLLNSIMILSMFQKWFYINFVTWHYDGFHIFMFWNSACGIAMYVNYILVCLLLHPFSWSPVNLL